MIQLPSSRRLTILDGIVLTIVMAITSVSARSSWPETVLILRQIDPSMLTDRQYIQEQFLEHNTGPPRGLRLMKSQLRSVSELVASTVFIALGDREVRPWSRIPPNGLLLVALRQCVALIFPVLVYLGFALLFLRLIPPRPGWGSLPLQPGCSACLAIVGSLFSAAWVELWTGRPISPAVVGLAVGLAWLSLVAARRWRPEKSWIDRAGRLLGVCWLAVGAISLL